MQHAAIEQHVRGAQPLDPCRAITATAAQKARQVPGDRRVGSIRQPHSCRPAAPPLRHIVRLDHAGKSPPAPARYPLARSSALIDAADQAGALAQNRDRALPRPSSLAPAASLSPPGSCSTAPATAALSICVPFSASRAATACASARSILSPPSRICSPTATRSSASSPSWFRHRDQREIRGAAADIDHQNQVARSRPVRASRDAARSTRRTRPAALRAASHSRTRLLRPLAASAPARPRRTTPAP